jgi:kinesin family protein 20
MQIFDLLDSVPTTSSLPKASASASQIPRPIPRTGGFFSTSKNSLLGKSPFSASFGSRPSLAALSNTNGGPGVLTRQALALKSDVDGGRYISGVKEIRVRSKDEAMAVFMMGQEERQVFGTLANRQSSRSHGVFTIKVVRVHNGAPNVRSCLV